jgi:glycosyltransferase involved in cell wall biosynthesis
VRIVMVISSLTFGGTETQVIALSTELTRRGHPVAVYTLNKDNPRAAELDGSGVIFISDQKKRKFDISVLLRLRRFISEFRADVVHGFLFDGDFYSRLAGVGTGAAVINSERGDNYKLNFNQRISHWPTRQLADAIVANSYAGAAFARRLFNMQDDRVHVVWNGLDVAAVDARIARYDRDCANFFSRGVEKVACLVGAIKPEKDYMLALQVADRLTSRYPEWRVLFVGEQLSNTGAYRQAVMRSYETLGLAGRVVFAGLRQDVPEIMSQCRVVFSTSVHEGFPNVVLEAMAAAVPAVSTEYSDIRRILPNAWQVAGDRSPDAIVAAILRADEEHDEVCAQQRAWVVAHATIERAAERLEAVYRKYVGVGVTGMSA